jgi:integrase
MVLGFDMPFRFSDAAMKERWRPERTAFSEQWIKDRIIGSGALMRLPEAERLLILGMINTGYRLMEGANLLPDEIVLDHDIPHLNLSGALRPLKTPAAYRLIPLTGISLEAFRAAPKGFASLRDDPALSARLNRFLTKEGLRETGRHTVHSFRHSFAARLAQAGVYEGMIAQLMGHKLRRGYGRGAPLDLRIKAIQSLGFQNAKLL